MGQAGCSYLDQVRQVLDVPTSVLAEIRDSFVEQLEAGLQHGEAREGNLPMIPTMVDILPSGREHGECYAIDFGGTNLRLLHVVFSNEMSKVDGITFEELKMPDRLHSCPVEELFDYVVEQLIKFSEKGGWPVRGKQPKAIVGFCFSFPVEHLALNSGRLLRWTKGYCSETGVGQDPVKLLLDALHRQGVDADVPAMVNDTVALLAEARYKEGDISHIALITGTGTNACYLDTLANIGKWIPNCRPRTPDMVVNTELPSFSCPGLPRLQEDAEVDAASCNPGQQAFEKLSAGMYLGEVVRRIMLRLHNESNTFGSADLSEMQTPFCIGTADLNHILGDKSEDLDITAELLRSVAGLAPKAVSKEARVQVKEVCRLVLRRASRLMAACIAGLLRHLKRDGADGNIMPNIIATGGGVFVHCSCYREFVRQGLKDLLGQTVVDDLELKVEPIGPALGAAAIAIAAHNYMRGVLQDREAPWPVRKFPSRITE